VALDILHRIPLSPDIRLNLARLRPAFARVSKRPISASAVVGIPLIGATVRYRTALSLAEVILRAQDLVPKGSGISGASILFFMPKIWEGYVARWVASMRSEEMIEAPYPFRLTKQGLHAEADVVAMVGSQIVALFDAKYKAPEAGPSRQDIYQMIAYCESLGLAEATLVYPGYVPIKTVNIRDKAVHVRGLRLDLSEVLEAAKAAA